MVVDVPVSVAVVDLLGVRVDVGTGAGGLVQVDGVLVVVPDEVAVLAVNHVLGVGICAASAAELDVVTWLQGVGCRERECVYSAVK